MSVQEFMENGGNTLKIHILKKINKANYIGGDDTKIVHLKLDSCNFGELEEDKSYSMIKPEKCDDKTLAFNPKFKPVKIKKNLSCQTKRKQFHT